MLAGSCHESADHAGRVRPRSSSAAALVPRLLSAHCGESCFAGRSSMSVTTDGPRYRPVACSMASTPHRALTGPSPRREPSATRRTRQRTSCQLGLDANGIRAYRRHGCTYRSKRPSRCPPRLAGRASHVQGPADPALTRPTGQAHVSPRRPHPRCRQTPPRSPSHVAPDTRLRPGGMHSTRVRFACDPEFIRRTVLSPLPQVAP